MRRLGLLVPYLLLSCVDGTAELGTPPGPGQSGRQGPVCGNGRIDPGEICDDGQDNHGRHGGCNADCTLAPRCGDGHLDPGEEQCDDGSDNDDTRPGACRTSCRLPTCGDGVADLGGHRPYGEACFFPERLIAAESLPIFAELNGYGRPDVIAGGPEGFTLQVATDDGFEVQQRFFLGGHDAFFADLESDGDIELLFAAEDGLHLYVDHVRLFEQTQVLTEALAEPRRVDALDVDADGRGDLAVRDRSRMQIWRTDDDGTLGRPTVLETNGRPLAGDFDGDGVGDLLAVDDHSAVLYSGFAEGAADGVPYLAYEDVVVADFDGDGREDLIYLEEDGSTLKAVFSPETEVAFNLSGIQYFEPVDLEPDPTPELLVLAEGRLILTRPSRDGLAQITEIGPFSRMRGGALVADLDGDGRRDLVTNRIRPEILLRSETSFEPVQTFNSLAGPLAGAADIDGDGTLDLWAADGTLFSGRGDGTFRAPALSEVHAGDTAIGDMDGDGVLDLRTGAGIFLGRGDGRFPSEPSHSLPSPGSTVLADVDQDGALDLLFPEYGWAKNLGDGRFELLRAVSPLSSEPVPIADFDGDGHPDVVAGNRLWFGDAAGRLHVDPRAPPTVPASKSAVLDVEGDGREDVLAIQADGVGIYSLRPEGLVQTETIAVPRPVSVAVDAGVLFVLQEDGVYWSFEVDQGGLRMSGRGTTELCDTCQARALAVADVSGDGRPDLVVTLTRAIYAFGEARRRGLVHVSLGTPDGFESTRAFGSLSDPKELELADLNGDGLLDVTLTDADEPLDRGRRFVAYLASP